MSSLFDLSVQYQRLMDELMMTDDLSAEILQSFQDIDDSLENKILNYTSIIKSMKSKADGIEDAVVKMTKRMSSLLAGADRLKEIVKLEMEKCQKKKIENEYHKLCLIANNPRVEYSDKALIPFEFMRHKIKEVTEPATSEILKALKDGQQVPGAFLVRENRLSVS